MESRIMPGKTGRTGNAVRFRSLKVIAGIVLMIVMTATTVMETRAEVNDSNIFDVTQAATETYNGADYAIYTGTIRMKYSEAYIKSGFSLSSRYFIPCDGSQMVKSSNTVNYDTFVKDNDNVVVASSDILRSIVGADYGEALNSYTINGVSHKCCQVKFENHSGSDIRIPCGTYSLILHSDTLNTEIYKITLEVYDPDAGSSSNTDNNTNSDTSSETNNDSNGNTGTDDNSEFHVTAPSGPVVVEDGEVKTVQALSNIVTTGSATSSAGGSAITFTAIASDTRTSNNQALFAQTQGKKLGLNAEVMATADMYKKPTGTETAEGVEVTGYPEGTYIPELVTWNNTTAKPGDFIVAQQYIKGLGFVMSPVTVSDNGTCSFVINGAADASTVSLVKYSK